MNFIFLFLILFIFVNNKKIIDVEHIDQRKNYPTGCESISTIMCLHYNNITITPEDFIDNYLDKGIFYYKNGQLFGPNPKEKFVGSPYDENSYGCYEPVITRALNKLITDKNLNYEVKNLTDLPMKDIIEEYIDKDVPVIFWASMYMLPYIHGTAWIVPETGEKFQWRGNEHCLLLVGYDNENYYFNDPLYRGHPTPYEKKLVEKRHGEQYSMAVALVKKN